VGTDETIGINRTRDDHDHDSERLTLEERRELHVFQAYVASHLTSPHLSRPGRTSPTIQPRMPSGCGESNREDGGGNEKSGYDSPKKDGSEQERRQSEGKPSSVPARARPAAADDEKEAIHVAGGVAAASAVAVVKATPSNEKRNDRIDLNEEAEAMDHSHTSHRSGGTYHDLLTAKDIQNSPLPIPVSGGSHNRRPPGLMGAAEPEANGMQPSLVGIVPPLTQDEEDNNGGEDGGGAALAAAERLHQPVEAVPITSVYQQVATAELYDGPHQPPPPSRRRPQQPQRQQQPLSPSIDDRSKRDDEGERGRPGDDEVERMRLQRQRFKVCKLSILLAILIVVIVVPIVITNQRLAAAGSGGGGGGSGQPCFPSYEELESAVDDYLAGGTRRNKSLEVWGDPIGTWCVSELPPGSGMDGLFSAVRNPKAVEFNDPLFYWDVSRVVSMQDMFRNCTRFNQPLAATWKVTGVERMTRMFLGATSFDQDLCEWGNQLSANTLVHDMFEGTSCLFPNDPDLASSPQSQPPSFCKPCQ
jgi:hypothetical protein